MAKNAQKTNALGMELAPDSFGVKEERLKRTHKDAYTHTHTDTHEDVYLPVEPVENRTKRLSMLAKPSVHAKLDAYARAHNDTFSNLVHTLMERFIEEKGL